MHTLLQALVAVLLLAVGFLWLGRERAKKAVPILSWIVPVLFGLMYRFEQGLGNTFGPELILPFLLLPIVGVALSLVGLALLWADNARPKGPTLLAATAAATPALAICFL